MLGDIQNDERRRLMEYAEARPSRAVVSYASPLAGYGRGAFFNGRAGFDSADYRELFYASD
jgi:hypothetical protein